MHKFDRIRKTLAVMLALMLCSLMCVQALADATTEATAAPEATAEATEAPAATDAATTDADSTDEEVEPLEAGAVLLLNAQTEGASPIEELEAELLTLGLTEDQAAGLVEAVPETTVEYVIFEAVIEEDEGD